MLRTRSLVQISVIASLLASFVLVVATGVAHAEIRKGTYSDPQGDSKAGPAQDITSVTVIYDTNGQITASVRTAGSFSSAAPPTLAFLRLASYSPPTGCSGAAASLLGQSTGPGATLTVIGAAVRGPGNAGLPSAEGITFSSTQLELADRDWTCATLDLVDDANPELFYDELDVPLFFAGYGPDADGDEVADNVDRCRREPARTATGCPTTAQRRAKALKACRKVAKAKRASCVKKAKRRYR